jgi:hypothetical protein
MLSEEIAIVSFPSLGASRASMKISTKGRHAPSLDGNGPAHGADVLHLGADDLSRDWMGKGNGK